MEGNFQTNDERLKIEDRLVEVEVQHKGLQELIATLKDGRGAQKVAEWQNKMEVLRLVELRHKREISRLKEQVTSTRFLLGRSLDSKNSSLTLVYYSVDLDSKNMSLAFVSYSVDLSIQRTGH